MKVLHITNNYPTIDHPIFGIFVKEQIDSLKNLGIDCQVFFINSREKGKIEYLLSFFNLLKQLLKNKYDLVHCHHAFSGFIYIFTLHFLFKPSILSYQNPPQNEGGQKLFRFLNIFFDKIIIKYHEMDNRSIKTIYLPNGVNFDFFKEYDEIYCKQKLGLDVKKKYILFMDSYKKRRQKRLDRFEGVYNYLTKELQIKNVEKIILTNTPRELIPLYLNSSAVHLITSDFEGSPNSVKESLACNRPVVSTNVGDVSHLLSNIKGCFVSNTFDCKEIALLVQKAINFRNFQGRNALINKNYSIEKVADRLINIYKNIINNKEWKKN